MIGRIVSHGNMLRLSCLTAISAQKQRSLRFSRLRAEMILQHERWSDPTLEHREHLRVFNRLLEAPPCCLRVSQFVMDHELKIQVAH
eukprot:3102821-Amphidinium_carterae.2